MDCVCSLAIGQPRSVFGIPDLVDLFIPETECPMTVKGIPVLRPMIESLWLPVRWVRGFNFFSKVSNGNMFFLPIKSMDQ